MKKLIFLLSAVLFFTACSEDDASVIDQPTDTVEDLARRGCATDEVFKEQLAADPSLAARMQQIDEFANNFDLSEARLVNGQIVIPVVVNVLYRTTAENISVTQIQSQIDVLNKDFNAQNSDFSSVPTIFSGVKANVGIRFELDQVRRKYVNRTSWGTTDLMKKSTGLTPLTPTTKLNLWVCTIGNGILGYAQFPGGSSSTDGVVVDSKYLGTTGTATYPFNLGRTATHEVGHWLNLRHIWGDATCGTDLVADTPTHNTANYGVPTYPHYSTCSGSPVEMTMNYMDYTDDRGMNMFTNGQKTRMLSLFAAGGARYSFAQ
ncbi:zinc metalloprotease [Faecalibacter bovis]|uniref:Zinc metalloprotease n=1 Tax=Faecalibacter bovis TaxID=2898187 RepID=A0ABX7XBB9_9FLAO|nr:zinc metalloprotease [Faecalibacter bovis]QTV05109.1 zinc metalloprotease [Faecalibacter bovis]